MLVVKVAVLIVVVIEVLVVVVVALVVVVVVCRIKHGQIWHGSARGTRLHCKL